MRAAFDALINEAPKPDGYEKDGLIYCPECNTPKQTIITNPFTGKKQKVTCICECEKEKLEREEQQRKEDEHRRLIAKRRTTSFEDSDYIKYTFAVDDNMSPKLSKQMSNYAKHFGSFKAKGQGLILFGDVGTGKTFFSACIANELIENGYKVMMTTFPSLIAKMQADAFKTDYTKVLDRYDLLIIDDLGVERSSEYMQEQVFSIIDGRYRAGKPFIISTNLTAEQLKSPKDVMAARIYGRILEKCLPIRFEGSDRRKKNTSYKEMQAILNG